MSGFKDVMKGGWHPKGAEGKKESWRGDFKGIDQVAGWMGKGKKDSNNESEERIARPLHTLKDPAAFGPPPKNVKYHGGAALPNQTTPDRNGLGAPLSQSDLRARKEAEERGEEGAMKPPPPPVPYRANRTGLKTDHLPPPPSRKDGADGRSAAPSPKPSLPPRLPPRQNSSPAPPPTYDAATAEPPAHKGYLNQGSLNRLGAAGISVPGLGIDNKPPPPPSRTSTASPSSTANSIPPASNNAQLGELQSRFSRLATSSAPPKADAPSQGTSFAQKQAAIRTASQFRNDPSSVSLSDARAAASTANSFQQRHGEQVKTGAKTANNLSQKYGIANKISSFAGNAPMQRTQAVEEPPQVEVRGNTLVKKKPPPPPVKRAALAAGQDAGSGPPPIPLASRPRFDTDPDSGKVQADLNLDLDSLWFASSPMSWPPPAISSLPGKRSYTGATSWSTSGSRQTNTFTGAIRHNDNLATTKIRLSWDPKNPRGTVKAEQKHIPPPRTLTKSELEDYRRRYSDRIASWCEARMGTQVGNGECWTLANDALKAIAAESTSQNQEPCMSSQSLVHGALIFSFLPPRPCDPPGGVLAAGVARGDIIQFLTTHFKMANGGQSWAGAPDHTAVVTSVESGGRLNVVESNVGGVKVVKRGSYDFGELVAGEVRIFRAVGVRWVGDLDAKW